MRHIIYALFLFPSLGGVGGGLYSCSSGDEEMYPSIVTNFADLPSDENKTISKLILDNGIVYTLSNPQKGDTANYTFRKVTGYVVNGESATLYSIKPVTILCDSTSSLKTDATGIESVWLEGKYINLQLTPKTQNSDIQYWGFAVDSISTTTPHYFYLTLHHNQNGDPVSYSTTVYASLPLKFIQGYATGDTISLTINTFKGRKEFILSSLTHNSCIPEQILL